MKSTYLDLQSDHSKNLQMRAFFFDVLNVIHVDPDFLSAVNSCLLPKKSQFFFLEKKHGKSGFCGFKDQHFSLFYFTRYIEEWFFLQLLTVGLFLCFFQVGSLFPILNGFVHLGISRPQPIQKEVLVLTLSLNKNEGKKHHLKKKTPC